MAYRGKKRPTHWDNVADWYDALIGDEGSDYHRQVILPGVLRLLDIKGPRGGQALRVLDLACGQGVLCRQLARSGATVLGIDAAPGLIEAARRRGEGLPVSYQVADVTKLVPLPPAVPAAAFDAVTLVLAIQNISPLSPVWQACAAALKPGGRLVVVMMHPCFRVPKHSEWHWSEAAGAQSRLVGQYLTSTKAAIQMKPGAVAAGGEGEETVTFHRPLQAYVNTMGNAGLWIDHLDEWPSHKKSPPGPRAKALDASRREIPMFLALRARKVARADQP